MATKDDCLNYLATELLRLKEKRALCDVIVPGDKVTTSKLQSQAYKKYMMQLGGVLHMLNYAKCREDIPDNTFEQMYTEALGTMVSTTAGIF